MHTTIAEADIQRASVSSLTVGQASFGPITVGKLVLTNFGLNTAIGSAELRNVQVTISHQMSVDWHLHIDIPGHVVDDQGTEDLGTPTFSCEFGDLQIPGLQNLAIQLPSTEAGAVAATATVLNSLQLGSAAAEQIQAKSVVLPVQGFTIAGLGLGGLRLGGLGVPAASVASVSIGQARGDVFPLPDVTLAGLTLPSVSVADVASQDVTSVATPLPKAYHLDLGCLQLTVNIKPQAQVHIDQVVLSGLTASPSLGQVELHNVVAPYQLSNLSLSQIELDGVQVPTIAIA